MNLIRTNNQQQTNSFIQHGGEMGDLIRAYPWADTAIGSAEKWPLSLRTLVNMMLNTRFPMLIFWGRELITFYNDAFRPSLGNNGKHPSSLGQRGEESWAESWPVIGPMINNIMAGGDAVWFEDQKLPIYREGKMDYAYWTYSFSPLTDDDGRIGGVLVTCSETTRAVETTMQLASSENRFQSLVRESGVGIIVLSGSTMKVEIVNNAFARLVGHPAESLWGSTLFSVVPETEKMFRPFLEQVLHHGEAIYQNDLPYTVLNAWRQPVTGFLNLVYQPYKEVDGSIAGIMVLCQDVTLQVQARQQIRESERQLLTSFNELKVGIAIISGTDLRFRMVNPFYGELTGRLPEQLVGQPLLAAMPELTGAGFDDHLRNVMTNGAPYVMQEVPVQLQRHGRMDTLYIDCTYQPQYNPAGPVNNVLVLVVDVTDKVLARTKVEQAEETLRMAVDAAELGIFSINLTDRRFEATPKIKALFGLKPDEALSYSTVVARVHEDYRAALVEQISTAILQGSRFDAEYPIITDSSESPRWVRTIGTIRYDAGGKQYFSGIFNEVTEKKLDELRKNDFISMVSHELKTPLTSLSGYLQFLQARALKQTDDFTADLLQKANKQIRKMTTMINGFLNVSRLESGKIHIDKMPFDMAQLLQELEEEARSSASSHRVVFTIAEPAYVQADRDKIGHVINNLLSNAVKYAPVNSTIQVTCTTAGGVVQVSVQDEGIGIRPEDLPKLFERYYRVSGNTTVAGFGIGLYLCKEIIDRHQGKIWVESELGKGSVFYFTLPMTDKYMLSNKL